MPQITVQIPREPYPVVIAPGALDRLGDLARERAPHDRALLAVDANVAASHGLRAQQALERAGYQVFTVGVLARESTKTLATAQMLYAAMLEARLDRRSPTIALGGGIVGDVAGFAAATFMRGVPLIHAPTTLLAMVDASIGGKTGVNFPLPGGDDLGKNLVGALWQPRLVLADPTTLATLERRELACGLAECIKHAMIADASLLRWIDERARDILHLQMDALTELIHCSATIKAQIVAEDERETGRRALLNLGHTFAHAIETAHELDARHGEAVAIGLRAAMHIAVETGRMTHHEQTRVHEVVAHCGLPGRLPHPVGVERLLRAMTFDKKAEGGRMRLVLPRGIGAAEVVDDVPAELVREAWLHIGASA